MADSHEQLRHERVMALGPMGIQEEGTTNRKEQQEKSERSRGKLREKRENTERRYCKKMEWNLKKFYGRMYLDIERQHMKTTEVKMYKVKTISEVSTLKFIKTM